MASDGTFGHSRRLVKNGTTCLPFDFTREVPARALIWLLQFGLPWSYWKESVGYSPSQERLVLTYGTPVVASIGRYVGTGDWPRWREYGDPKTHPIPINPEAETPLVLVEDLVSAHKVAAAGFSALPLFTSKVTPHQLKFLIKAKRPMVLWLDKDKARESLRDSVRLAAITRQLVARVVTDKDPKWLALTEINSLLESCLEA